MLLLHVSHRLCRRGTLRDIPQQVVLNFEQLVAIEADFVVETPLEVLLVQQGGSHVHQKAQIVEFDVLVLKIWAEVLQTALSE